jgi:hypothetical protein
MKDYTLLVIFIIFNTSIIFIFLLNIFREKKKQTMENKKFEYGIMTVYFQQNIGNAVMSKFGSRRLGSGMSLGVTRIVWLCFLHY